MSEIPHLINDLSLILIVASVVTLIFKRLKQPLALGYIVAGFLVSPHMPYIPSIVDRSDIQTWADIGVIFLLFSMGLDFSIKKIAKLGAMPIVTVVMLGIAMFGIGYTTAWALGWTSMERAFLGSVFSICSSTTIIYKTLTDLKLRQQAFANLVLGILVVEDVLSIIIMVILSTVAQGNKVDGSAFMTLITRIVFFVVLWFVVGIYMVPLFLRKVRKHLTNEILLVISLGFCFLLATLSARVGFSTTFGAFVMGVILAETVEGSRIIKIVDPLKDLFGAVFFVSVGMLVDVHVIIEYALPILCIVVVVVSGMCVMGTLSFLISGHSLKTSMRCSFSMAQIGEFPFIIASMGLSLGVIGNFMYPVIVTASAITTFLTPYIIKSALPCYSLLEKKLPQTWVKRLNRITMEEGKAVNDSLWHTYTTKMVRTILIYSILSVATIILMLTFGRPLLDKLLPTAWANAIAALLTLALISPFLRSIIVHDNHSDTFKALWTSGHKNRLPLIATVALRTFIALTFIFYICHRLTHLSFALIVTIAIATIIPILLSRRLRLRNMRMERTFIENLRSKEIEAAVLGIQKPKYADRLLDRNIHITDIEVPQDSKWVGKTLAELDVRNNFGVHISSILRGSQRINIPQANMPIFPFDKLQVIGSDEQLSAFDAAVNEETFEQDVDIEQREMKLQRFIIDKDNVFVNKTLEESGIRDQYSCMVVGLEDAFENLKPVDPTHRLAKGDVLWVVGEQPNLKALKTAFKL